MIIVPDDWERRYAAALQQAGWTLHPPGSSCIGDDHAYAGKTDTSYGASIYVLPRTGTVRERVLSWLRLHGPLTDPELQQQLGLRPNSERPRRVELVAGGFVRDSGRRKKHRGREHIIWEVVTYE